MGDGEMLIDGSVEQRGNVMKDFRRLQVWEKAHMLTLGVYKATAGFPREERFGLSAQLRRASASIPSNIAEGCGRSGNRELARFLQVGMGSARELEYQLLLARDLGYIEPGGYAGLETMVTAVEKMLGSLIRKVRIDDAAPNAGPRAMATRSKQAAAT